MTRIRRFRRFDAPPLDELASRPFPSFTRRCRAAWAATYLKAEFHEAGADARFRDILLLKNIERAISYHVAHQLVAAVIILP